MSLRRVVFIMAAIAGLGAGAVGATAAGAEAAVDIRKARPLTSEELYQLYNSRSWLWKAGAGHFSTKERRFTAWSKEEGSPSYAIGQWFITNPGRLCFRATWHSGDSATPALTCFSHRKVDGVIYQKREPDGEWTVFRSAPARRSDEWAKLRLGDHVASRLRRVQASFGR